MTWRSLRTSFSDAASRMLSVDIRALAVLRIGIALILIADIAMRFGDVGYLYGPGSMMPNEGFWIHDRLQWSLHTLAGSEAFVWMLAAQLVAALALLVGYRTTLATIVSFLLLVSLHYANRYVLHGGDVLMRLLLCIGIFLPLGAAYSIDARRRITAIPVRVYSIWSAILLMQVAAVYLLVGLSKVGPEWQDGSAALYALRSVRFATGLGSYVAEFPRLLEAATHGVVAIQILSPVFFFAPLFRDAARFVIVGLLTVMHAAFGLTLSLSWFSLMSMLSLVPFLPTRLWDGLESRVGASVRLRGTLTVGVGSGLPSSRLMRTASILAGCLYLVVVSVWNIENMLDVATPHAHHNRFVNTTAVLTGLTQRWVLFSPSPPVSMRWFVIRGERADGTVVDAYRAAPYSEAEPADVRALYGPMRHGAFMWLVGEMNEREKRWVAGYFCGDEFREIRFIYLSRPLFEPATGPVRTEVVVHTCQQG